MQEQIIKYDALCGDQTVISNLLHINYLFGFPLVHVVLTKALHPIILQQGSCHMSLVETPHSKMIKRLTQTKTSCAYSHGLVLSVRGDLFVLSYYH